MASSDARPIPIKNQAFRVTLPLMDGDGDLVSGAATLDSELSGDGATFADATNEATEIATASGIYFLDLTAAEMNFDTVAIIIKTATAGAKTTPIVLYPQEAGDIKVDLETILGDAQSVIDLKDFADAGYDPSVNKVEGVKLVDTITTYTGDTPQTGDNFARLGAPAGTAIADDIANVKIDTAAILVDTAEMQGKLPTNNIMGSGVLTDKDDEIDAIKVATDQLAFTAGNVHSHLKALDNVSLSTQQKTDVNAEVDTALNTAIPGGPTVDSINERVKAIDDKLPTGNISDFDEASDNVNLGASGMTLVKIETSIATGVDLTNDTGTQLTEINMQQMLAVIAASLGGVLSGASTTAINIKPAGNPSGNTRIAAVVDASGNRSALTLKVPD